MTVLDVADLEQIANILEDLRDVQLAAGNAHRSGSTAAVKRALKDLLDHTYEATSTLADIPGITAATHRQRGERRGERG